MMGGSSGGLTVLGILADHPDLVAGGVASYPVSDLADLAATTHRFEAHYTDTLVGDPADPATRERFVALFAAAPSRHDPRSVAGVQGSEDPVVLGWSERGGSPNGSGSSGGTVDLRVYEGEGHGISVSVNTNWDEYVGIERFLNDVIGGVRRSP